jgi:hypothetical protein
MQVGISFDQEAVGVFTASSICTFHFVSHRNAKRRSLDIYIDRLWFALVPHTKLRESKCVCAANHFLIPAMLVGIIGVVCIAIKTPPITA